MAKYVQGMGLWVAIFLMVGAVSGQETGRVFSLQDVDGGTWSGPYRFEDNGNIILSEQLYEIDMEEGNTFRLRSLEGDKKYGPFEFVMGRIIKVAGDVYVIAEKAEDSPAGSKTADKSVEPTGARVDEPMTEPQVAEGAGTTMHQPVALPPAAAEREPAVQPTVKPIAPSSPDRSRTEPVFRNGDLAGNPLPPIHPVPRVAVNEGTGMPEVRNRAGVTFITGEATDYNLGIADTDADASVEIKRDILTVSYERGFLYASWGLIMNSAWDSGLDGMAG